MANIVELREMSDNKLEEMLETAREEMFNLRFRKASAQLEDYSRIRHVRREIAQLETVLNNRQQAIETAVSESGLAAVLAGKRWDATAFFSYEDSAWQVDFIDEDGNELATAMVNLNKKRPTKRQARQIRSERIEPPKRVTSYEIVE